MKILFRHQKKLAPNTLSDWFKSNRFNSIPDKCHAFNSTKKHLNIKTGNYRIGNSKCKKLLGVQKDVHLNFNNHISDLCEKASKKICALA